MSVKWIDRVFKSSAHRTASELLMLLALADYADDSGESYPSVATLAHKCRMNVRNANYVLRALQKSGELFVRKNQGPNGTNRYKLVFKQSEESEALQSAAPLKWIAPLQSAAPPALDCTLQPVAFTPAADCTKTLQSIADKPSLKRQEPSAKVEEIFERFYEAYPKKVAKPMAKKAFKIVSAHKYIELILLDVESRKVTEAWKKDEGQYIPNPATYLNQRRWEDAHFQSQQIPSPDGGIIRGAI